MQQNIDGMAQACLNSLLNFLIALSCFSLVFLIVVTFIDVVGRYFFNSPLEGSIEITQMTLAFMFFTSLPVVTYQNRHIVVNLLDGMLSDTFKRFIAVLSNILIIVCILYIAQDIDRLLGKSISHGILSEYLEIPQAYVLGLAKYTCYFTALLMAIGIVQNVIKRQQTQTD